MSTEKQISQEHVANHDAVRRTLIQRGIRPEKLPPAEDVKKVERRVVADQRRSLGQPDVLGCDEAEA